MKRAFALALLAATMGCPATEDAVDGGPLVADVGPADGGSPVEDAGGADALSPHPCDGREEIALWVDAPGTIWIGCGQRPGLFVSRDGGTTWSAVESDPPGALASFRVWDLSRSADGRLYVAGQGEDAEGRTDARRLLALDTSDVVAVAEPLPTPDVRFIVANYRHTVDGRGLGDSHTGIDVLIGEGGAWRVERSWSNDGDGYQIAAIEVSGGALYAAGATIDTPPVVFLPPEEGDWWALRPVRLSAGPEAFKGLLLGLAVVDPEHLVTVGYSRSEGGLIFWSAGDPAQLESWTLVDPAAHGLSRFSDVCASGRTIVAVGPEGTLRSDDWGESWQTPADPPGGGWQTCALSPDGTLTVAGPGGAFARVSP